jgi:hypothetical protein
LECSHLAADEPDSGNDAISQHDPNQSACGMQEFRYLAVDAGNSTEHAAAAFTKRDDARMKDISIGLWHAVE